jgi:GxxExxY protein
MHSEAELNGLAREIIGAAIAVHRRVGPGCLESAYSPCFALELTRRKLDFRREFALTLRYDELVIPRPYVLDYVIEDCIVAELKSRSFTSDIDSRQVQTYLEISGLPLGLILNFGCLKLVDGIKRVVNNFPHGTTPLTGEDFLIR